jgi:hypothetical protein
MPLSSSLG